MFYPGFPFTGCTNSIGGLYVGENNDKAELHQPVDLVKMRISRTSVSEYKSADLSLGFEVR